MFKNYFKIITRVFWRNKFFTIINITGLAIGIACAAMIYMWVNDEINFDKFHQNKDQIYRILLQRKGTDEWMAITPGLLADAVKQNVPEVQYAARIMQGHRNPYQYKNKAFYEDESYCVDPDFFKIFTFPLVQGDLETALELPNNMVISEETAEKYYGDENPIGKNLRWNNRSNYQVSAVVKDMPHNSSIHIQLMESHVITEQFWKNGYNWTNFVHETYLLLKENSAVPEVAQKIEKILNENCHVSDRYYLVHLQPLSDIHLNAGVTYSTAVTGDGKYVTIFSIIAAAVLIIACFNFINISIANSLSRAKEVGIRKVVGSQRSRLIFQFIGEFALLTLIAACSAVLLLEITLPVFNGFTGKTLALDSHFLIFFLIIISFVALFAGSYPAFYLSSISPSAALKSQTDSRNKASLRSVLVVLQFAISVLLIVCTFIINSQLHFIQNKKLGFAKDNVLYIPAKGPLAENFDVSKNRLLQYPDISGVTMQQSVPITTINGSWVHWKGQTQKDLVTRNTQVTPEYFTTMNIDLKEGRYFSEKLATDKENTFILNEAAVKYLDLKSPVGMEIQTAGRTGKIIGIVKNSNFKSLHHEVEPLIFMPLNDYRSINLFGVILIKYSTQDVQHLLKTVEDIWQEYNANLPFEYHFLDQTIDRQYGFEKRLSTLSTWFSLLAISISISGLLGLAMLLIEQRTKEIGIRKVLGASVTIVVATLTSDFIKWILLANLIAYPIAWYSMNKWLQNFAYRIDLTIWPFLLSGLLALLIALLTVSWQAIRSATANPVTALKYE